MPPLAHADWWAGLVDSLCDSIEAMDASPYVTISAGGWRRVRDRQTVGGHLEFWAAIGDCTDIMGSHYVHDITITVTLSAVPDNDGLNQGRIHAAAHDLCEHLLTKYRPADIRIRPTGFTLEDAGPETVILTISAQLHVPRQ